VVTITKSITIDGGPTLAGVLTSGSAYGILVNAGPSDVVVLRNLDINGTPATPGADSRGGGITTVRNSTLSNNAAGGTHVDGGTVDIVDSLLSNNGIGIQAVNGGQGTPSSVTVARSTSAASNISIGGALFSYSDNAVRGNAGGDALGASIISKQ
jgi:hypothetical protein